MDFSRLTIEGARSALDKKEFSSLELTNYYIENSEKGDSNIHAYLEMWKDTAREEAKKADERIARGEVAALTGIPLALKDNILLEGRVASAASKILENYTASFTGFAAKKLVSEGAVFVGRTSMDEFAMGGSTENSAFGNTKNPLDIQRVPGGSSGGSAAAVAAGYALGALGSDTGGSIRQPASFCGLVGLKPTYGAVSRSGLIAMGSSLDQIGPLTKTVRDSRILFNAIQGKDPLDSTSIERAERKEGNRVIGVPRGFLKEGVDADVLSAFEDTLSSLKGKGYQIRDIELPTVPHSLAVYYILMPAESSTNFARFDGIRYGLSEEAETLLDVYAKTRGVGFGKEVRRRILIGTFVLSAGYADAYYRKARSVRARIRQEFEKAFEEVEAIVLPTTPTPAFKIGEKEDPLAMYAADIFTVPANLAGIPGLSVPSGTVEREGVTLPVGFQILASHSQEETLFEIGEAVFEN